MVDPLASDTAGAAETPSRLSNWVDGALSSELPVLRALGESQSLEYMATFPTNGWELAKEIAAFATKGPGRILLGVGNDGELLGLAGAVDFGGRDSLLRRLHGICHGTVKPPITPRTSFGMEEGKIVLLLDVPRGDQPVYYASNVPYIRHITQSRPADPSEVVQLVREWLETRPEENPLLEHAVWLADILGDMPLYDADLDRRMLEPAVGHLENVCLFKAQFLREFAATDLAVAQGWSEGLRAIASAMDAVVSVRPHMGGTYPAQLKTASAEVVRRIKDFVAAFLSPIEPPDARVAAAFSDSRHHLREVVDFWERFEELDRRNELDRLQSGVAGRGRDLARLRAFLLRGADPAWLTDLDSLALRLHSIETMHLEYGDGGAAVSRFHSELEACSALAKGVLAKAG